MNYSSIADVRAANERIGHQFFDRETMQFFRYALRLYSVREVADDGSISTVGEFQQYLSRGEARAVALARALEGAGKVGGAP